MATILFLEDENMIREVLSEYMVVAGHEVVSCERGDEAIKLIEVSIVILRCSTSEFLE